MTIWRPHSAPTMSSITDAARPGFSPLIIAAATRSRAQPLQPLPHHQSRRRGIFLSFFFFNPLSELNVSEDAAAGAPIAPVDAELIRE